MNKKTIRGITALALCGLLIPALASNIMTVKAGENDRYTPLNVQSGFNVDLVAEAKPFATTTTGSFDGPDRNDNHVLFSEDYDPNETGGLPRSGAVTSVSHPPIEYQLAPYNQNNALRLNQKDYQTGTLEFSNHGAYNRISILGSSASGAAKINVTINYTDGTASSTKTFNTKEWFYMDGQVFSGIKRLSRNTGTTNGGTSGPRLYQYQLDVDPTRNIQSVSFTQLPLSSEEDGGKYSSSGDGSRLDLSTTTVLMAVTGVEVSAASLTTTDTSANGFVANWEDVAGAVQYTLDVATDPNFTQILPEYNNKVVTGTSHAVTGLKPATTYYYRIIATNTAGTTFVSSYVKVDTLALPSGAKLNGGPKTGDTTSILSMVALLCTAGTVGIVATKRRKKA